MVSDYKNCYSVTENLTYGDRLDRMGEHGSAA
jgi:hypothetical protein